MLPQLKIHVDGSGSVFRTAERGVMHIRISSTSTNQTTASNDVQQTAAALTAKFRIHATKNPDGTPHSTAGITAFNASAVSTSSYVPIEWDETRRRRLNSEREYTATASHEAVFRDFQLMAAVTDELASMPHVSITGTEWRLTAATKSLIAREARIKAIGNAVEKANDYAGVVGRKVVAVEIKDGPGGLESLPGVYPGMHLQRLQQRMMQQQQQQQQQQQMQMQMQPGAQQEATTSDGPAVEPTTITASAQVNVRFVSLDGETVGKEAIDDMET